MNEKFNIRRIGHLLKYDWMCVRKRLLLSFIIIELIYIIMIIGQHYGLKFFHNSGITPDLVLMMASYLMIMSGVALFIIWSGLVWRKFSHKETASTYMMLPANISERFVTLHLSGLLAFVIWYIFCEINVAIPTTIMFGFT